MLITPGGHCEGRMTELAYEDVYRQVLRLTRLEQYIESLSLKDKTVVGENGVKLSGGQIQKIAIARALLKKTSVYFFDEATVHLDAETFEVIRNIIENELKYKICIIIDHKDGFEDICNKLVYLNNIES